MTPRRLAAAPLLILACLTAGCGHSAAPAPTPDPLRTAVPQKLASYAAVANLSLRLAISAGHTALSKMQHEDIHQVGNDCSQAGDTIANAKATYLGMGPPPRALSTYRKAHTGFHYTLAALDKCGIASDSADPHLMRAAESDLRHALALIISAQATLATWDHAKS